MRKAFIAFALLLANMFCMVSAARADSLTAGDIFGVLGGTTTIDQGGSLHSQARSIYSLGGGMTSFQGKRVSLLSADPPSFSAGCSGISWHFGGFGFISVDEIRQLVEAVAQASLGVAVDLAMQTLCPQCYAVMAKLRDIANQMRNAAADSCKVAKNFGKLLQDKGIFSSGGANSTCAESKSAKNEAASWLDSIAAGGCKLLNDAETAVKGIGDDVTNWMGGKATSDGKTPNIESVQAIGNRTYHALDALGYKDGIAKDMLMTYLGMTIVVPPDADCKSAFAYLQGTSTADGAPTGVEKKLLGVDDPKMGELMTTDANKKPTVADANTKPASPDGTGSTKGTQTCYVPPLIEDFKILGSTLVCGYKPLDDAKRFGRKFHSISGTSDDAILGALAKTALGELCKTAVLAGNPGLAVGSNVPAASNAMMLTCRKDQDNACMRPRMVPMSQLLGETSGEYTGLAWMVLDALYTGVIKVREGKEALPTETIRILNGSGYPLYRLINLAAVYPGMADEMLQAYGAIISVQYVMDTLEKVSRIGAQPSIHTSTPNKISPGEIASMREQINQMYIKTEPIKNQTLRRMNEKRALVDSIVQVNRAVQAEVISRGLGDNNNMAISLRKQATRPQ